MPVAPIDPPPIESPDRLLKPFEQRQQATLFFQHFSGVMLGINDLRNTAAEIGSFDTAALVETMFADKLIPDAWRIRNASSKKSATAS